MSQLTSICLIEVDSVLTSILSDKQAYSDRDFPLPLPFRIRCHCIGAFTLSYLPSLSRFGVLEAPSRSSSAGLVGGGGVWIRDPLGFRAEMGAEMEGRRELANVRGRPSSESLSPAVAVTKGVKLINISGSLGPHILRGFNFFSSFRDGWHSARIYLNYLASSTGRSFPCCTAALCAGWIAQCRRERTFSDRTRMLGYLECLQILRCLNLLKKKGKRTEEG